MGPCGGWLPRVRVWVQATGGADARRRRSVARIKPVMNQVELHPYLNQAALRADMAARGIAITAYSPLGNVDPASLVRAGVRAAGALR